MNKKICLVTGGTSGVGKAITLGIAEEGHGVVVVSRTKESGRNTVDDIIKKTGNTNVSFIAADLSVQDSIRALAEEYKSMHPRLNVLANCAGILKLKKEKTPDGINTMLAVDYLSHFYLTNLLMDILVESAPSRVITVAGNPRYLENIKIDFDDIKFEKKRYNGFRIALICAVMRAVFSFTLANRMRRRGVSSNAFHPGLVKSRLGRNLPIPLKQLVGVAMLFIPARCPTGVYLALSKELECVTGEFFAGKKPASTSLKGYAEKVGGKLWEISEILTSGF